MKNEPRALIVGDAPKPFMLIHDLENIWQVVRANRPGDAKLIRTIRRGLDRKTNLRVTGCVSRQALSPSDDGTALEVSGKGLFQLLLAWSAGFGVNDDVRPSYFLADHMGLQAAEDWVTGTLAFLARDHSKLLSGDIPSNVIGDFDRYQAAREWDLNREFWQEMLA